MREDISAYYRIKETIDLNELKNVLEKAYKIHPYRKYDNPDSYSDYNQGWQDALNFIADQLGVDF